MTVRIVIALELPDDDELLQPIVDDDGVIPAPTSHELAADWLEYSLSFNTTGRYDLVAVEQLANS